MAETDPYARQRMLAEIGERGQESLLLGTFSPNAGLDLQARTLAIRYARAAGFGQIGESQKAQSSPLARHFRHTAAAQVGLAAAEVLHQALAHFDLKASEK